MMWISIRNTLKNGWEYSRGPRVRGRGLRPPSWPNTGCIYGKFKTKVSGSRDWTTCQHFWFFRLLLFLCAVQKAGHNRIVVRIPGVFHICCGWIVMRACFKSFSTHDHAFNHGHVTLTEGYHITYRHDRTSGLSKHSIWRIKKHWNLFFFLGGGVCNLVAKIFFFNDDNKQFAMKHSIMIYMSSISIPKRLTILRKLYIETPASVFKAVGVTFMSNMNICV